MSMIRSDSDPFKSLIVLSPSRYGGPFFFLQPIEIGSKMKYYYSLSSPPITKSKSSPGQKKNHNPTSNDDSVTVCDFSHPHRINPLSHSNLCGLSPQLESTNRPNQLGPDRTNRTPGGTEKTRPIKNTNRLNRAPDKKTDRLN